MIDNLYLELQNPWWQAREKIDEDDKLVEFRRSKYQFRPAAVLDLKLRPADIHLLTGPRQTGKSTAVKLLVEKLIKAKVPPRAIFYYNCDALSEKKEIIDIVIQFLKLSDQPRYYLFLDEISTVADWPYAVKWLKDGGLLRQSILMLTGSSSINLKKSGELLPGRRGKGKDLKFLPLSFSQFIRLKHPLLTLAKINLGDLKQLTRIRSEIAAGGVDLNREYHRFLQTGGLLKVINQTGSSGDENELYLKTLRSEIFKAGKKEDNLRQVIDKIIRSLGSQTSYNNIAQEAELGSKNTAVEYLGFLKDSFFLNETKFFDIPSQRVSLKKNKKFYPLDPYFLWLFHGFVSGSLNFNSFYPLYRPPAEGGKLAEMFAAGELTKAGLESFFYASRHELDFYLPHDQLGIEVKYQPKITAKDLNGLAAAKRKIVLSKNLLESRGDAMIIPIELWATLIPFGFFSS